jgi:hypothetical protein
MPCTILLTQTTNITREGTIRSPGVLDFKCNETNCGHPLKYMTNVLWIPQKDRWTYRDPTTSTNYISEARPEDITFDIETAEFAGKTIRTEIVGSPSGWTRRQQKPRTSQQENGEEELSTVVLNRMITMQHRR